MNPETPTLELPPDPSAFAGRGPLVRPTPVVVTPEQPPVPVAPPPVVTPPVVDPQVQEAFQKLASMEKEKRESLKAVAELQDRVKQLEPVANLAALRDKPLELMAKLGLDFKTISDAYVQQGPPPAEKLVKEQVDEVKRYFDSRLGELETRQRNQLEAQEQENIRTLVNTDEKFAITKTAGAQDLVWQTVQKHYNETRELLSYEQAATAVESSLESLLKSALTDPKVKARLLGTTTDAPKVMERAAPVTLSNQNTQEVTRRVEDPFDPLTASDDELIKRLAPRLKFRSE